jgi:hypothetical protein
VSKMSNLEEVSYELLFFLGPRVSSQVARFPVASPCLGKLRTPHFTLYTPHLINTLLFTLHTPHFTLQTNATLYSLHPHGIMVSLHSTLYTLHSTLYTPHYTLYFKLYTLHSALCPVHCKLQI